MPRLFGSRVQRGDVVAGAVPELAVHLPAHDRATRRHRRPALRAQAPEAAAQPHQQVCSTTVLELTTNIATVAVIDRIYLQSIVTTCTEYI